MGGVVEKLAFLPPDRPNWHESMKKTHRKNLYMVPKKGNKKIATLWFYNESEYTILYSHGNAEDIAGSKDVFEHLALILEVNFCAYDYEGYGLSVGECTEKNCFDDITAVFNWLTKAEKGPQIEKSKIILFGRSLGSGPTVHLAAQTTGLAGLILQSPLRTAIKTQMPDWMANSILKGMDIFKNESKIDKVQDYPVYIIHGTEDQVVPFKHGEYLYKKLKTSNNKCYIGHFWVKGCGHNDIEHSKQEEYFEKLQDFLNSYVKSENKKTKHKKSKNHKKKLKNSYNNNSNQITYTNNISNSNSINNNNFKSKSMNLENDLNITNNYISESEEKEEN